MANYMPPKTPVSEAFLSRFNIEYLHGTIVKNVSSKTGMNIDRQSDGDLQLSWFVSTITPLWIHTPV